MYYNYSLLCLFIKKNKQTIMSSLLLYSLRKKGVASSKLCHAPAYQENKNKLSTTSKSLFIVVAPYDSLLPEVTTIFAKISQENKQKIYENAHVESKVRQY